MSRGDHIIDKEFQSDKYPETPRGFVPLKVSDPTAQPLLWQYAQAHRAIDPDFADDLEECLRLEGYDPSGCPGPSRCHGSMTWCDKCGDVYDVCHDPSCDTHGGDDG